MTTIVASPWSRGGKVCSQLFDHTSTLQFLETFVNKKFNKNIRLENISQWRRTIAGDLTTAFSPFDGKPVDTVPFVKRDPFVEDIFSAKFKEEPAGYKNITGDEIQQMIAIQNFSAVLPKQESRIRPSFALPYELYADSKISADKTSIELKLAAGKKNFGNNAAGSPFTVSAPVKFNDDDGNTDILRSWSFAVAAGDILTYAWPVDSFENSRYHLRVNAPNGFYREYIGSIHDPLVNITCEYELDSSNGPTSSIIIKAVNADKLKPFTLEIKDNAYGNKSIKRQLLKATSQSIVLPTGKSRGWYDFSITITGINNFEKRYAGRVETGKKSFSDPLMGG